MLIKWNHRLFSRRWSELQKLLTVVWKLKKIYKKFSSFLFLSLSLYLLLLLLLFPLFSLPFFPRSQFFCLRNLALHIMITDSCNFHLSSITCLSLSSTLHFKNKTILQILSVFFFSLCCSVIHTSYKIVLKHLKNHQVS